MDICRHSVRIGEHRISTLIDCDNPADRSTCNEDDPPFQDLHIKNAIKHKNFTPKTNDIGLITLKTEVKFKSLNGEKLKNVGTICLPLSSEQIIDSIAQAKDVEKPLRPLIAGWGRTENTDGLSDVLMFAKVPLVSFTECTEEVTKLKTRITLFDFDPTETHLVSKIMIEILFKNFHNSCQSSFSVQVVTTTLIIAMETAAGHSCTQPNTKKANIECFSMES